MGRPVVHWELWSESPDKISRFYQQVWDQRRHHEAAEGPLEDPDGRVLGMRKQQK